MTKTGKRFSTVAILLALFLFGGCGGGDTTKSGTGNVIISLHIPDSGNSGVADKFTHVPIGSVELTIVFDGYSTVVTEIINATGGTVTRSYTLEPETYTFSATAYEQQNLGGAISYQGSTVATVSSAVVAISLPMTATSPLQAAVDGINTSYAEFKSIVNALGTSLTASNVLFIHDANYLDSGWDRNVSAADIASHVKGMNLTAIHVETAPAPNTVFDQANNILTVESFFSGTAQGSTHSEIFTETFKYDATSSRWLMYGNQQLAEGSLFFGKQLYLDWLVSGNPPSDISDHDHVFAPVDSVTSIELSSSLLAGGPVTFLPSGNTREYAPGYLMDEFAPQTTISLLQQPAQGDTFTFTVTASGGGTSSFTQTLPGNIPTETPVIDLPNTFADHDVINFAGKTITVPFTIPTFMSFGELRVEGEACNLAGYCESIDGTITAYDTATGIGTAVITIPSVISGGAVTVERGEIKVKVHLQEYIYSECVYEFSVCIC